MNDETTVDHQRYGCAILLHRLPFAASDAQVIMVWENLPFATYGKFKWYFRYRAALIQIQHPKRLVEIIPTITRVSKMEGERITIRNKIISAKAQITKIENAIAKHTESHQPTIFEPTFQDTIAYKKAADKLDQVRLKLKHLEGIQP